LWPKKKGGRRGNISVTKNDRGSWDLKKLLSTTCLEIPTSYVEKKKELLQQSCLCFLCVVGEEKLDFSSKDLS
jgi:hypothetical protein